MKKRLLAILMAAAMVMSALPTAVFATEHVHEYAAVVTPSTCTEGGYTTYTCDCGDTYITDETPATGHTVETWHAVDSQIHEGTCIICGAAVDGQHDDYYEWQTTKVPTCTEAGTEALYCTLCEYALTASAREIPATGHSYENGVCTVCGEMDPNADGVYTIENITADQTVTVEGVMEAQETDAPASYIASIQAASSSSSSATVYTVTPEVAAGVYDYIAEVPEATYNVYITVTLSENAPEGATITAAWINKNNDTEQSATLTSGTAKQMSGLSRVDGNAATITVGADGDTQTYTLTAKIVDPRISALSLTDGSGAAVRMNETFLSTTFAYTATTTADTIVVSATPKSEGSTVTYNGAESGEITLVDGENVISIVVDNGNDTETYTLTVTKTGVVAVTINATPADALVFMTDRFDVRVWPGADGAFSLMAGTDYNCTVTSKGYVGQTSTVNQTESTTIEVTLTQAAENSAIDTTIEAEWGNFRKGDNHLGITDAPTPYAPEDAELLWAVKYGTSWSAAPGSPIIVDNSIITYVGSTIKRLDINNGELLAEGTMVGSSSYSIVPATYADGMIFVGLSGGRIQAFNASTLESLWLYTDPLGGQPNCPITYKDGYIYAGFWNSEVKDANFACISVTDENISESTEAKYASWTYARTGGFYWAGAYASANGKYVVVGTDDGNSGYNSQSASLLVFDRFTGELIDSQDGILGDIRSNVSYDPSSDRVFFTTKGGILGNAKIDWNTGKITDYKQIVIEDANGNANAMSTCTPSIYNGRIYIGVAGTSQFTATSGHGIAVYNLDSDGSMSQAYVYGIIGYPQTSAMVTTAYAGDDGYVYIYLPYNYTPGGISVLKDKPGQTAPLTTTNAGYSEVFTPVSPLSQYCICSAIADSYGTIYYKNDSLYVMAITSKIESLEITAMPTAYTLNEDGVTYTAEGLQAVTNLKNGMQRDVTDYVTVTKDEETGNYTVSYTYGFDSDNYGLTTLTQDIIAVTLPEGEGYIVTGDAAVLEGESYTFTVDIMDGYQAGENFAVKVNGETVTAVNGQYIVESVVSALTITVEGVEKSEPKPVTVYFSFSHDDQFEFCEDSGETMALKEVTVPYFDLANYGLEQFYFSSEEYGDDGDGQPGSDLAPGTAEFAYGKVTMLHLFIYATEVYYCGIDPEDAGQGYLNDAGILGTEVFNISGSQGSSFLNNIWNYDLNLNYYRNYEYPLAGEGWGATSDQILLHDGDIVTLGHFSSWSFFNDSTSIFNYMTADKVTAAQGDEITLTLYHAGLDWSGNYTTAHTVIDYQPDVYYMRVDEISTGNVVEWNYLGTAEADGTIVLDTTDLEPGKYMVAMPGQFGAEETGEICSTPGGIIISVTESEEPAAVPGDVDGDGTLTMADIMLIYQQYTDKGNAFTEEQLAVADVNADGKINMADIMAVYKIYKGAE